MDASTRHRLGWLRGLLLLLAVGVSFGACFFARDWDVQLPVWGGSFAYWWAAQGAVLVFILVVALYAAVMNRIDVELNKTPGDAPPDGPDV